MKNLKKLAYLAVVMLLLVSCEKENIIEPEILDVEILDEETLEGMTFEEKLEFYGIDLTSISSEKGLSSRVDESGAPIYTPLYEGVNTGITPVGPRGGFAESYEYYFFYGIANSTVSIEVRSCTGDLYMSLYRGIATSTAGVTYNSGGSEMDFLTLDDDSGCSLDPFIQNYTLPEYTGFYTVAITGWSSTQSHNYNIELTGATSNPDKDDDGILNQNDNCPDKANSDQADIDEDGIGDVCDDDNDNDGILNEVDNCPLTYNPDQADNDNDGLGDVCDDDDDNDGVLDEDDNCAFSANADQADNDNDDLGDVCDDDDDNDGVLDEDDNCALTYNPNQEDYDDDGMGDACDDDDDNDGVTDSKDNHQFSSMNRSIEIDGCWPEIENMMVKRGTNMQDEINDVIELVNAMEDVSDARRTSRFKSKMYFIVNNWKSKYRLIDVREKRTILNCVNNASYPFDVAPI